MAHTCGHRSKDKGAPGAFGLALPEEGDVGRSSAGGSTVAGRISPMHHQTRKPRSEEMTGRSEAGIRMGRWDWFPSGQEMHLTPLCRPEAEAARGPKSSLF